MKVFNDEQRGNPLYTVPKYSKFVAVWTKFDTSYFQIFCWRKKTEICLSSLNCIILHGIL